MSSERFQRVVSGVMAVALSAGLAVAQSGQPAGQPGGSQPIRVQPMRPTPAAQVPDNLLVKQENGKIQRWKANVDLLALKVNPLISDEQFEALKPAIVEWQKKVDRQVIENPDFAAAFEGGLIDRLTLEDMAQVRQATEMVQQLAAVGPLSGYLQQKGHLDPQQFQAASKIVADYQQALMNELMTPAPGEPEEVQVRRADDVSNFLYEISTEDAVRSYRRQLASAATNLDKVLPQLELTPEQESSLSGAIRAAKGAKGDEQKVEAMRTVMAGLTTIQQRNLLDKAYALAAPFEPTADLPDLPPRPELAQPPAQPVPAPAAAGGEPMPEKPLATSTTAGGVLIEDLVMGTGEEVKPGATVTFHYRGSLKKDGSEFQSSYTNDQPVTYPLSQLIPGWQEGIPGMKVGGKRRLTIPYALAYGESGRPPTIPPKADLVFDIEILAARNR